MVLMAEHVWVQISEGGGGKFHGLQRHQQSHETCYILVSACWDWQIVLLLFEEAHIVIEFLVTEANGSFLTLSLK